ncbi:MAG: NADH-quinone oxidoreductase subunit 5 family protein [Gammaproteobacteria bacterium]
MSIYTLIPLLPLAASFVLAIFRERLEGTGHRLVVPAVAISFFISVAAFFEVSANGALEIELYRFLDVGGLVVDFGFYIDQLTVLVLLLVTGVGAIVQVYSSRYMMGDRRHSRFFAITALFTGAMAMLVMSSNLAMTFIFWEVMGICSYLLISHYGERPSAAGAATKVFLVNSVADVGLFFGVILTFRTFGTLNIPEILELARAGVDIPTHIMTLLTLCLFSGAVGKSAQMPAHVWLPFAMEAPTPVSALIHAATMVNAGPFLLVRLSPVIVLSPTAMTVIATVGAVTALFAALVSLTQTDIKRTLAYSTISQLGFMTMLCGVGAFVAAIFHLIAHGFFKAFMFLSTGNVLASTHRHFETAEKSPPRAMGSLFAGAFILAVIPPLVIFSGAYQHLWLSQSFASAGIALWIVGLGTVFFTAMYLFDCISSVFSDGPPGAGEGRSRVVPSVLSAQHVVGISVALVVVIGAMLSVWRWFAEFLSPVVGGVAAEATTGGVSAWLLIPLAAAAAGWAVAYARRNRPHTHDASRLRKKLYVLLLNKGYFDEVYDAFIVRPTISFANWVWLKIDQGLVDRLVVSLGSISVGIARQLTNVDRVVDHVVVSVGTVSTGIARRLGYLDRAVDRRVVSVGTGSVRTARWLGKFVDTAGIEKTVESLGRGVDASGHAARRYEPRTLQHNLLVIVFWLIAALGFFYWIAR